MYSSLSFYEQFTVWLTDALKRCCPPRHRVDMDAVAAAVRVDPGAVPADLSKWLDRLKKPEGPPAAVLAVASAAPRTQLAGFLQGLRDIHNMSPAAVQAAIENLTNKQLDAFGVELPEPEIPVPSAGTVAALLGVGVPMAVVYFWLTVTGMTEAGFSLKFAQFAGIASGSTNAWLGARATEEVFRTMWLDILQPLCDCRFGRPKLADFGRYMVAAGLFYGLIGPGVAASASMFTGFERAVRAMHEREGWTSYNDFMHAINYWMLAAQFLFVSKDLFMVFNRYLSRVGMTPGDAGTSESLLQVLQVLMNPETDTIIRARLLLALSKLPVPTEAELADPHSAFSIGCRYLADELGLPVYQKVAGAALVTTGLIIPTGQSALTSSRVFLQESGFLRHASLLTLAGNAALASGLNAVVLPLFIPLIPMGADRLWQDVWGLTMNGVVSFFVAISPLAEFASWHARLAYGLQALGNVFEHGGSMGFTFLTIFALLEQTHSGGDIEADDWFVDAAQGSDTLAVVEAEAYLVNHSAGSSIVRTLFFIMRLLLLDMMGESRRLALADVLARRIVRAGMRLGNMCRFGDAGDPGEDHDLLGGRPAQPVELPLSKPPYLVDCRDGEGAVGVRRALAGVVDASSRHLSGHFDGQDPARFATAEMMRKLVAALKQASMPEDAAEPGADGP